MHTNRREMQIIRLAIIPMVLISSLFFRDIGLNVGGLPVG
jgi:hypothetical protein